MAMAAGGVVGVLIAVWLVTAASTGTKEKDGAEPEEVADTEPDATPEEQQSSQEEDTTPEALVRAARTSRVRDRLRVLVLISRPVDLCPDEPPARILWQSLVQSLSRSKPDVEIAAVWPPTLTTLGQVLEQGDYYHVLVIDAPVQQTDLVLEDEQCQSLSVASSGLRWLLEAGRIRLLVARRPDESQLSLQELAGHGVGSCVISPPGISDEEWVDLLSELLRSLSRGTTVARAANNARAILGESNTRASSSLELVGARAVSLVDHTTDKAGLRLLVEPRAPDLRPQPWFRDHSPSLSQLVSSVRSGRKVLAIVGQDGLGKTSVAIEAGHRLSSDFETVIYLDCVALAQPSAAPVLLNVADKLHCQVMDPSAAADVLTAHMRDHGVLTILDHAETLPEQDSSRLVQVAESAPEGSCFVVVSREPPPGLSDPIEITGITAAGAASWIQWLSKHKDFPAFENASDRAIRRLTRGVAGNALAIRLAVGMSDRMGLLQAIRTAANVGTLHGMVAIALDQLGKRETETAKILAGLPSPVSADIVESVLGRSPESALARIERSGLTSETAVASVYQLHPTIRAAILERHPSNSLLLERIASAVVEKAQALSSEILANSEGHDSEAAWAELEALVETFRFVMASARSEAGPLAGRMDVVRDLAMSLSPIWRQLGIIREALDWSQAGQEAAQLLNDHGTQGRLLLEAAENYRESGDVRTAITCYQEAARALEEAKSYRLVAQALVRLGTLAWDTNQLEEARQAFQGAAAWFERLHDVTGQVRSLIVLGDIGQRQKDPAALDYYKSALRLAESQENLTREAAQIHYALGHAYSELGNNQAAIEEYVRAVESSAASGDAEGRAQAYTALGQAYLSLGDTRSAVQALEKAAQLEEQQSLGISATVDLGLAYMREKRWRDALNFHRRALSRAASAGDREGMAQAYNGVGNVFLELGERDEAIRAYEEAVAICKEAGDQRGLARTYNNLAVAYRRLGKWEQAQEYLEEALNLLAQHDDKRAIASVYNNIGLIMAAQGKKREATNFYKRSLALKEEIGDLYSTNITKMNLQALNFDRQ